MKSLSMLGLRVPLERTDSSGGNEVWRRGWADRTEVVECMDVRFWRLLFTAWLDIDGLFFGFDRGM